MKNLLNIGHYADIQVKVRELNLYQSHEDSLITIENVIAQKQLDVIVIAGDFFEFAEPNDAERKLIYNHIARVLKIECVKELVLMVGNHDIIKDKKALSSNNDANAVDTFTEFLKRIGVADKVTYLKEQKQYISKANDDLAWIAYSLEDGSSNGNNLDIALIDTDKMNICIYHDILREYVDDSGLPVKKQTYDKLATIEQFPSSLIFAGDIHEKYIRKSFDESKTFFYPGSTIQRNYGEGTYIKIRNKFDVKHADPKYVIVHSIDVQNRLHEYEYIELPSIVNHIQIDLNATIVPENFIENIKLSLNKCIFGRNETFIRLILSNAFISHEKDIFTAITDITNTKNSLTSIEIRYDKIISKNTVANSILGSSLNQEPQLDENGNVVESEHIEITGENLNENFDNILLDKVKLTKLFKNQLDQNRNDLIKELGDEKLLDEVYDSIMAIFEEQLEFSMGAIPNFKVKLLDVQTNGFMQLGANTINLDIPGLTRITGTNGVGKTTLYNIYRFLIDGIVIEGLKTNQKVNNNLLVFNDELPNNDNVIVRSNTIINDTPVQITRYVIRKWKPKATEEDKKSIDKRKFIDSVTSGLEIVIESVKNGTVKKTGDEAESLLRQWFGNTINNIVILNQHKILTMLNMPSENLRQLVMDYIGVDYLDALDRNLETVKNGLNTKRPKRNKLEIRNLIEAEKLKEKTVNDLIENFDKDKIANDLLIANEQEIFDALHIEVVDLGNIPQKIIDKELDIVATDKLITDFVSKVKKDIPLFLEVAPVKPGTSEKDTKKSELDKSIETNTTEVSKLELLITGTKNDWYKENNGKVEVLQKTLDDSFTKLLEDANSKLELKKTELIDNKTILVNYFQGLSDHVVSSKSLNQTRINELNFDDKELKKKIEDNKQKIESGVCSECKKPLDDDIEHFEQHKLQLETDNINYQKSIDTNKIEFDKITINNSELDVLNTRYLKFVGKLNNNVVGYFFHETTPDGTTEEEWLLEKELIETQKSSFLNLQISFKDLILLTEVCSKATAKDIKYFNIDTHKIINDRITLIKSINDAIVANDYIQICTDNKVQNPLYLKLNEYTNQLDELNKTLKADKLSLQTIIDELKIINDDYVTKLETFNTNQTAHTENVTKITNENNLVDEHNKLLSQYEITLNNQKIELGRFEKQKPKYEELKLKYKTSKELLDSHKNDLAELVKKNNESLINQNNIEKELKDLDIEYNEYLDYQKDIATYAMYAKIIKKDFKDSVFGYYREFLNITFNLLLNELNFKLYWHENGELYYYQVKKGEEIYRPVQLVSGMQTCFLGLALIYAIHVLNVKNNISHLFIDEISGQLNSGKELVKSDEEIVDYQEKLLLLLSKFTTKNIFIVDHVIKQMWETVKYQVNFSDKGSIYEVIE